MYENAQTANAVGYQNQVSQGCAVSPPKPTVTAEITDRLEKLNAIFREIVLQQRNLIERLHGPRPETNGKEAAPTPNAGALGTIEERLKWLAENAQELSANQNTLNRLA